MLYALKVSGRLKNDKIIVPSLSWVTDVSSVMQLGLQPILCDSNMEDLAVDLGPPRRIVYKRKSYMS